MHEITMQYNTDKYNARLSFQNIRNKTEKPKIPFEWMEKQE